MVKIVYDGKGAIFGRLASGVAKELLKGNRVEVINCKEIVVSGKKKNFIEKLQAKRKMGRGSSLKGPKYILVEGRLVKRMIRGMLPWDRMKGREAFKRLKCHTDSGDLSEEDLKDARRFSSRTSVKCSTIKEIIGGLR